MSITEKYLFYTLGGPGSGKTTMIKFIKGEGTAALSGAPEFEFLLNKVSLLSFESVTVDTIKERMSGIPVEDIKHPHPEKTGSCIDTYKEMRADQFYHSFSEAANIYMDDHGDLARQDREFLAAAKKEGYRIVLVYVSMPPLEYLKRQYELGKQHHYDPLKHMDWALNIFKTCQRAFAAMMPMADDAFILERNGANEFVAYSAKDLDESQRQTLDDRIGWEKVNLNMLAKLGRKQSLPCVPL